MIAHHPQTSPYVRNSLGSSSISSIDQAILLRLQICCV